MRFLPLPALLGAAAVPVPATAADEIDFARDIRPILSENCIYCHGPDEEHREAGLRLDLREDAFADRDGVVAFVPGDLDKSESWYRIITDEEDDLMPPPKSNKKLTAMQKDLLKRWIESGAEWTEHWSFVTPQKPEVPDVPAAKAASPIDAFLRHSLAGTDLEPSAEADRRILLRRLSLDLTGLPPTLAELEAFVSDKNPEAYEKLVDRLLASKHFGERMATYWLDAARYGDTSVMHADGPRDMWPWRDWVVDAFNENYPFDRFSIEQIAGDLLPEATLDQQIASGFNRNHPSSDEGGAIAEELRVSYVVDRVKTTSNVWLGLSMECGQCHDHKYDPISQKEYYQFYAYFNNTADPGMQTRRGNQAPVVEVVDPVRQEKLATLEARIIESQRQLDDHRKKAAPAFDAWAKKASAELAASPPTVEEPEGLAHWFALDETSGNKLLNAATGAVLTIEKGKLESADRDGVSKALKLNGRTQFKADVSPELEFDKPFSLALWLKFTGAAGAILSKMDDRAAHRGFDLWVQGKGIGVHVVNTWPSNALKVVSKDQLKQGKWQHVVVTYDGSHKQEGVKIYIDGKLSAHQVEADSLDATIATKQPFRVGSRSTGANFKGEIDDLRIYDRVIPEAELAAVKGGDPIQGILALAIEKRTENQQEVLLTHYLGKEDKDYKQLTTTHAKFLKEQSDLQQKPTTSMVMEDNEPNKKRMTYVLERGHYESPKKDEEIHPAIPAILPPLPDDAPANRLGLARWLFADDHPLTSRVAVNQIWQLFFGTGIVATPADFGAQGSFPSHPGLLDWLAVDFRENGWDIKRLVRQIVTSQAYRQCSDVRPGDLEKDPENLLLARAPRFRLPAEFIRDNALDLGGLLLRDQVGGPGVKPYQPPGLWAEVGLGGNPKFVQDHGDKLYRRSLYTYWKRSAPPPAMQIFDAPTRETCVLKRPITNTPLQALAAMNDIQMIEASRHFAERIMREGGETPESRAGFAFESATAREPNTRETSAVLGVYQDGLEKYRAAPEAAEALLSAGESKRDNTLDPADHAAWTLVASLILNLDEVLTRN